MAMFKLRRLFRLAAALLAIGGGVSVLSAAQGPAGSTLASTHASVAFIVNTVNAQSELSVTDLRRMLLGEVTRWPDGRKVTVAMREPGAPEREAVLRLICRMGEADFTRYLLHLAYRGESQSPLKQLDTPLGVRRFVFNVPGAIGYVRADELDDSVKAVRVVGTAPSTSAAGLVLRAQ